MLSALTRFTCNHVIIMVSISQNILLIYVYHHIDSQSNDIEDDCFDDMSASSISLDKFVDDICSEQDDQKPTDHI